MTRRTALMAVRETYDAHVLSPYSGAVILLSLNLMGAEADAF
jgi:hypothetical protein